MKSLNEKQKNTIQLWLGFTLAVFGMIGLVAGFWCPPLAQIDNSVLVAFGEVSTFSAGLIGIDYTYKYKIFMNKNSKNNQDEG